MKYSAMSAPAKLIQSIGFHRDVLHGANHVLQPTVAEQVAPVRREWATPDTNQPFRIPERQETTGSTLKRTGMVAP
jgi:hypothetical protein